MTESARDILNIPCTTQGVKVSFMKKLVLGLERTGRVIWKVLLSLQRVTLVVVAPLTSGLILAMIVFRYFLKIPALWVEELCLYLIPWLYLLGASYGTYKRTYIVGGVVDMFFKNSPRVLGWFKGGAALICLVASCVTAVLSYNNFIWLLGINPRTTMLSLPLAYSRLSLAVGFSLMALYFLTELIESVRADYKFRTGGE